MCKQLMNVIASNYIDYMKYYGRKTMKVIIKLQKSYFNFNFTECNFTHVNYIEQYILLYDYLQRIKNETAN